MPLCPKKEYIVCVPEFGIENVAMYALVWQGIYGFKSTGKYLRDHLRSCMRHLYFASCPANPDVWIRPVKHLNGTDYYEFILLYNYNALVISKNTKQVLRKDLGRYFEIKEKSIGPILIHGKIHWTPQNIFWRIYKKGRTRK